MTALRRPQILLNFAESLDGKIHPAPAQRPARFAMSRGKEDFRRMRWLREQVDAVLIGASNLRIDDPGLSLHPDECARRRDAGIALPARVIVTRRAEGLEPNAKVFDPSIGGKTYVLHGARLPQSAREKLAPVCELVELGEDDVPMSALLAWFADTLRAPRVLCEGGGILVAQLFAARAVDELYLTLVPRVLGGANAPTLVAGDGFGPDQIPDAKLLSLERIGEELYLRYGFDWSESAMGEAARVM